MIKSIKTKIILAILLVVMISLFLSGAFAYNYFLTIFKEKAIQEDMVKINQMAQQLEYQINDIKKLGQSFIINNQLQNFVKRQNYKNKYEEFKAVEEQLDFIASQTFLRDYIHSTAIITANNSVWSTILRSTPHDYFTSKLNEEWYKEYLKDPKQYYFTDPFQIFDVVSRKPETVISCIIEYRGLAPENPVMGRLLINIYLNYFQEYINTNINGFDGLYWINQSGVMLYKNTAEMANDDVGDNIDITEIVKETNSSALLEKNSGYYITRKLNNGWQLVSFTSEKKLFSRIRFLSYFFIISTLVSLLIIIIVVLPLIFKYTSPLNRFTLSMDKVAAGDLDVNLDINTGDEFEKVAQGFNQMVKDLKGYIAKVVDYEKNKKKLEFDILLSQINPHFIYNVLNTVIYMARKKGNQEIVELMHSFIRVLQDGIKIGEESLFTTVKQEVEIVQDYINIQKYRYRERFEVNWQIDNGLLNQIIPKTLIQPLVDNALYHGIIPSEKYGNINVTIKESSGKLLISVEDNGIGIDREKMDRLLKGQKLEYSSVRSIGIVNIRDRINYLYGNVYGINIESEPGKGTIVKIILPR